APRLALAAAPAVAVVGHAEVKLREVDACVDVGRDDGLEATSAATRRVRVRVDVALVPGGRVPRSAEVVALEVAEVEGPEHLGGRPAAGDGGLGARREERGDLEGPARLGAEVVERRAQLG